MRTISIRQPWAWLIVHGGKTVENRTWRTGYRGPLAIHASKTLDTEIIAEMRAFSRANHGPLTEAQLAELEITGAVIGVVDLVDCTLTPSDADLEWSNPGAWAWVLRNPRAIKNPVIAKGRLGLFDLDI